MTCWLDAAFSERVLFPDEKEPETPEDSAFDSQYVDEDDKSMTNVQT